MARPYLLWFALVCASLTTFATTCAGLHLKLTHVDAKENCTTEERMRRAHRRLLQSTTSRSPRLLENQYIAELLIGDPPQKAEVLVDTGSSLVWTQNDACSVCFRQNLPRYDPTRSRTAGTLACADAACAAGLGSVTQCGTGVHATECFVHTVYNAFDEIAGDLATDEFTFGSEKVTLAFGSVAGKKGGTLDGASGMVGLGRGPLSLVSQLGEARKFSYCLTPFFGDVLNPSHLLVGNSAVLTGGKASVTTVPFVKSPREDPYSGLYFVPLVGISVGKARLDVPAATFDLRETKPGKWAGTVVDSGTSFMSLVDVAYQALKAELEAQLGASLVLPPRTVLGRRPQLCVAQADLTRLVPPMVLHFGNGGGDVVLPPENYWAPVGDDAACMAVFTSGGSIRSSPRNETTIIGSFMQQNMQVLFDLGKDELSFLPMDCSSFQPPPAGPPGGQAGNNGSGRKSSSPYSSSSGSSGSSALLPLPVFSLMSLLMLNGAPGVRGF
ncbi:hypothetical protein QOZ80_5BG0442720 [Eleusine coracana subsp. coracana]|nr:hypothetical protein QOZ80_5BG0442720 [Eleusine coracana subsp. coracana]